VEDGKAEGRTKETVGVLCGEDVDGMVGGVLTGDCLERSRFSLLLLLLLVVVVVKTAVFVVPCEELTCAFVTCRRIVRAEESLCLRCAFEDIFEALLLSQITGGVELTLALLLDNSMDRIW
jgi:hypothetical protein